LPGTHCYAATCTAVGFSVRSPDPLSVAARPGSGRPHGRTRARPPLTGPGRRGDRGSPQHRETSSAPMFSIMRRPTQAFGRRRVCDVQRRSRLPPVTQRRRPSGPCPRRRFPVRPGHRSAPPGRGHRPPSRAAAAGAARLPPGPALTEDFEHPLERVDETAFLRRPSVSGSSPGSPGTGRREPGSRSPRLEEERVRGRRCAERPRDGGSGAAAARRPAHRPRRRTAAHGDRASEPRTRRRSSAGRRCGRTRRARMPLGTRAGRWC
jgi:hypothetical protein